MIVTITHINDYPLLLVAGLRPKAKDDSIAKLLALDWLVDELSWQQSKSIVKLKKHYKLSKAVFKFIDNNSLSKDNPVEALLLNTLTQLECYKAGKLQQFDIPLDLSIGTEFQQKVWQGLQRIPYGETISYAELAQNIGKPTAYRAVANANGKNPFSIIIPCHRVVASDGSLGGYTGGLDKKLFLLKIENKVNKYL